MSTPWGSSAILTLEITFGHCSDFIDFSNPSRDLTLLAALAPSLTLIFPRKATAKAAKTFGETNLAASFKLKLAISRTKVPLTNWY